MGCFVFVRLTSGSAASSLRYQKSGPPTRSRVVCFFSLQTQVAGLAEQPSRRAVGSSSFSWSFAPLLKVAAPTLQRRRPPSVISRPPASVLSFRKGALRRACPALTQDPPSEPTAEVIAELRRFHPSSRDEDSWARKVLRPVASGFVPGIPIDTDRRRAQHLVAFVLLSRYAAKCARSPRCSCRGWYVWRYDLDFTAPPSWRSANQTVDPQPSDKPCVVCGGGGGGKVAAEVLGDALCVTSQSFCKLGSVLQTDVKQFSPVARCSHRRPFTTRGSGWHPKRV